MIHTIDPAGTPSPEAVATVRDRYPTDGAGQLAIDRKYERRRGAGWSPSHSNSSPRPCRR